MKTWFLLLIGILAMGCLQNPADELPAQSPNATLELVAEGFSAPVAIASPDDGTGRLFVVDQVGTISIMASNGKVMETPFLDLKDRMAGLNPAYDERGLLGLAFHPDYSENGRFFVYYSAPARDGAPQGWDHTSHVSEFRVSAENPDRADSDSERIVMQIDQPQSNHVGGQIAFGPEGYLYIPLGDGGAANDVGQGHPPDGNGQNTSTLLGSILRIDVSPSEGYVIPPDNPLVGKEGRDEIYAYGFRNPFHISFDSGGNRSLFAGDVGQNRWEEVDIVKKGGNYGWNIREGDNCFSPSSPDSEPEQCPEAGAEGEPLIAPILEYKNANAPGGLGHAVIGGAVYRGPVEGLYGKYVFGDWSTSFGIGDGLLLVGEETNGSWNMERLSLAGYEGGRLGAFLLGFGTGSDDEMYVLTTGSSGPSGNSGKVYKIVQNQ